MTTLGYIAFVIVLLLYSVWSHCELYKYGYQKGHERGLHEGRKAADDWWINQESEVDRERVKIWREET